MSVSAKQKCPVLASEGGGLAAAPGVIDGGSVSFGGVRNASPRHPDTIPDFVGVPFSPDLRNLMSLQDASPTYAGGPIVLTAIGETAVIAKC
jgi:hypothetical protein